MDVFSDANDLLVELGVHFEQSASEATAAAMLAASVNYPLRGAVTWKSTVGTNVASDALANVASGGVTGGALVIVGEDYGEGSSIMQERSHAFAMKSQIWLLDPAAQPAEDRRDGGARLRAVRGVQHPGDARAAHPRLPHARPLRGQGQPRAPAFALADAMQRPGARHLADRAAAGQLRPRAGEDRDPLARGGRLRARAPAERDLRACGRRQRRPRHRGPGRALQHPDARARAARASPTATARRRSRSTCSTSPIR